MGVFDAWHFLFWFVGKYTAFSSLMRFKGAHVFELRYIRTSCLRGLVLNRKFNLQLKGFRCDCCRVKGFSLKCIAMLLMPRVSIGVYLGVFWVKRFPNNNVRSTWFYQRPVTKCIIFLSEFMKFFKIFSNLRDLKLFFENIPAKVIRWIKLQIET